MTKEEYKKEAEQYKAQSAKESLQTSKDLMARLRADPKEMLEHKSVMLIDNFMELNSLNIIYGNSGSGKSMLTLTLCVWLLDNAPIDTVNYFDFDNGVGDQKRRGIPYLLSKYGSTFNYVNLNSLERADITPPQALQYLLDVDADKDNKPYANQLFIFDTMGELVEGSLGKDEVIRPLMDKLKRLRTMGGTVMILHHTTKDKEADTFFGSAYIKIKIDGLWLLTPKDTATEDYMEFALECKKDRSGELRNSAFSIVPSTHTLNSLDFTLTTMSNKESDFVERVKTILVSLDGGMIDQTTLLKEIGTSSDDKTARKLLKDNVGNFWKVERVGKNNSLMYSVNTLPK